MDPCDPPVSISSADFTDNEYTLTDNSADYSHPAYEINPNYCTFEYAYDISELFDANSQATTALTQSTVDPKMFSYYYD